MTQKHSPSVIIAIFSMLGCHQVLAADSLPPLLETDSTSTVRGEQTVLMIHAVTPMPRHDSNDYGTTTLSLLTTGKKELSKREVKNVDYGSLGYSLVRHAYVLKSIGEIVSKPGIDNISYLSEKNDLVDSKAFASHYVAYVTIPGPDAHFIAFVGCPVGASANTKPMLYALDTKSDKVIRLGAPPAPSPGDKENWSWDRCELDQLEPSICHFTAPDRLLVSYGNDTYKSRAKIRRIQIWNLVHLAQKR